MSKHQHHYLIFGLAVILVCGCTDDRSDLISSYEGDLPKRLTEFTYHSLPSVRFVEFSPCTLPKGYWDETVSEYRQNTYCHERTNLRSSFPFWKHRYELTGLFSVDGVGIDQFIHERLLRLILERPNANEHSTFIASFCVLPRPFSDAPFIKSDMDVFLYGNLDGEEFFRPGAVAMGHCDCSRENEKSQNNRTRQSNHSNGRIQHLFFNTSNLTLPDTFTLGLTYIPERGGIRFAEKIKINRREVDNMSPNISLCTFNN